VRPGRHDQRLRALLVDADDEGYLLQIFTKNCIGPVFFELIAYDGGGATPAWRMATVRFNTEPTKVLPAEVWARP